MMRICQLTGDQTEMYLVYNTIVYSARIHFAISLYLVSIKHTLECNDIDLGILKTSNWRTMLTGTLFINKGRCSVKRRTEINWSRKRTRSTRIHLETATVAPFCPPGDNTRHYNTADNRACEPSEHGSRSLSRRVDSMATPISPRRLSPSVSSLCTYKKMVAR